MNDECKAYLWGLFNGFCIGIAIIIGLIKDGIIKI